MLLQIAHNTVQTSAPPAEPKKTNEESFGGNLPLGYVGAKKRPIGFAPWKNDVAPVQPELKGHLV